VKAPPGGPPEIPAAKPAPPKPTPVAPMPAAPTLVRVTSQPAAARVLVNGRDTGKTTPATVSLGTGQQPSTIQLELPGYETAKKVVTDEVIAAKSVEITMVPRAPVKPMTLVATGEYPFDVSDGRKVVSAARQRHDVDVSGLSAVHLRSDQYFLDQIVPLDRNDRSSIAVTAHALGSLSVYASGPLEDCKVYVDNRLVDKGGLPLTHRQMASGVHQVQLRCRTGNTDLKAVAIPANQDVAAQFPIDTPLRPK